MRGKMTLYVDQHGNHYTAKTVKELREKVGGGKAQRMYLDGDTMGERYHVGYVVGRQWLRAFTPVRVKIR